MRSAVGTWASSASEAPREAQGRGPGSERRAGMHAAGRGATCLQECYWEQEGSTGRQVYRESGTEPGGRTELHRRRRFGAQAVSNLGTETVGTGAPGEGGPTGGRSAGGAVLGRRLLYFSLFFLGHFYKPTFCKRK